MDPQIDQPISELRHRVRACRGRYDELSGRCGMSKSWLSKFANGKYQSPRYLSMRALEAALEQMEQEAA